MAMAPLPTAQDCLDALPAPIAAALLSRGDDRLFVVGGWLRDLLLGRPNHDLDLAVDGEVVRAAAVLARRLGATVVNLDQERGTIRVVLHRPVGPVAGLDLTRLRQPLLEGDLRARDFTINAIAVPLGDAVPSFVDPTGGLDDLRRRLVRMASPGAFEQDPLRLLRAVRFVTELSFDLDDETRTAAQSAAPLLPLAARERQRDELAKILACDTSADGVALLDALHLLPLLLPDLELARGVEQPREHYYNVLEHCLQTLAALDMMLSPLPPADNARAPFWRSLWQGLAAVPDLRARLDADVGEGRPRLVSLKLAGLLHDVSKPETKTIDATTGKMRFFGHAELGGRRAEALARGLRFSGREAQYIALLIHEHLRPGMLAAPGEAPTRRALYRFFRDLGDAAADVLILNLADHAAARGPLLTLAEWQAHVDYAAWVLRMLYADNQVARPPRLLNGNDLMVELGLRPGPVLGRLLETIREAQAAGEVESREEALLLARQALPGLQAGSEAR